MSDLGAIFHVKKEGVQYDAHAYTTLDECPYPNIKINFNGQQGYVKLENKGEGDVPCYVKPKSEDKIYQVRAEAIPTGMQEYPFWYSSSTTTFTVPYGIHVIKSYSYYPTSQVPIQRVNYIGVTAGKTYTLELARVKENKHLKNWLRNKDSAIQWGFCGSGTNTSVRLEWSPEINKETPTITDY